MNVKKTLCAVGLLACSCVAQAGLLGSELSLRTLAQSTPLTPPVTTSFERRVVVSEPGVEFPDVRSLFDPNSPVPPGFARSLVNTAINVGDDFITIDFDNAGFNRFATAFENTYVFRFDSTALLDIVGASIDRSVTTLGLADSDVRFRANELFVNVESLPFDPSTFARIDLRVVAVSNAIPEPSTLAVLLIAAGLIGAGRRRQDTRA